MLLAYFAFNVLRGGKTKFTFATLKSVLRTCFSLVCIVDCFMVVTCDDEALRADKGYLPMCIGLITSRSLFETRTAYILNASDLYVFSVYPDNGSLRLSCVSM